MFIQLQYYNTICIKHVGRTQLYFTMSSTLGIQLHVSALYIGHRQVVLKLIKELYKMCVGCPGRNEISSYSSGWHGLGPMERYHYKYSFPLCIISNLFLN